MASNLPQVGAEAVIANMPAFNQAISDLNKKLKGAGKGATTFSERFNAATDSSSDGVGKFGKKLKGLNTEKFGGAIKGIATLLSGVVVAGALAATAAIGGVIVAAGAFTVSSVETAISVESAWAGIVKTTDGLVDEFGNLTEAGADVRAEFRELVLSVPTDLESAMGIGELAGQLGIASDQLVEFTETAIALGVATNLSGEEAASAIAKIQNIFAISADDMALNASQFGSAIVELGNNFATTEADVLAFATRIAGAGKIAGLSQADILGIGAAMSSVGVEAESGGTAVQKALLAINEAVLTGNDDLATFADTAGLSAEQFSDLWKDDAAGAFEAFVSGLGKQGDEALGTLADLGLEDQRLIKAFLSLAGAGDLLGDALDSSNKAFEENSALAEEAAKRYATTESQMVLLKNTFRDISLTVGEQFLPIINDVVTGLKDFLANPEFREGIKTLAEGLGTFFDKMSEGAFATELLPMIGEALNSLFGNIDAEDAAGGLAGIADIINDVASGIVTAIETIDTILNTTPIDLLKGLGLSDETIATILTALTVVGAIFTAVFLTIKDAVVPVFAQLQNSFAVVGEQFSGLGDSFQVIGELIKFVGAIIGVIFLVLLSIVVGVITGIINALPPLITMLAFILAGIIEIIAGIIQTFKGLFEIVIGLITGNSELVQKGFKDLGEGITKIILGLVKTVIALIVGFVATFDALIEGLIDGVIGFFENLFQTLVGGSIIPEMVLDILKWILDLKTRFNKMISDLVKSVIGWAKDMSKDFIKAITNMVTDAVDELFKFATKAQEIGKSVADGLLKGIKDNIGKVLAFLGGIVESLVRAAMSALEAKSPSKRFINVGKTIPEGLAEAVNIFGDIPIKAVGNLVDSMINVASSEGNKMVQNFVPAPQVIVQGGNTTTNSTFAPNVNATVQPQSQNTIANELRTLARIEASN